MMKTYSRLLAAFFWLCAAFTHETVAQLSVEASLRWGPEPERFVSEGQLVLERWSFEGADFDDSAPFAPVWHGSVAVSQEGKLRFELLAVEYEPFPQAPAFEEGTFGEELRFHGLVSRTPTGWVAKVSCVPIVQRSGQYLRAKSFRLGLRIDPLPAVARGPQTFESVLSTGDVYQLAVEEEGVYKLTYAFLKNTLGITNLDNIDPRTIKLYGNGGGKLPEPLDIERQDDLAENHIFISGEGDGRFDASDYILFYGQGPHRWTYNRTEGRFVRQTNIYDTRNYYFLKVGPGPGLRVNPAQPLSGGVQSQSYDAIRRYERDAVNPLFALNKSPGGQGWYGEFFKVAREQTFRTVFSFPGLITSEPARAEAVMGLRSNRNSFFQLLIGSQTLNSLTVNPVPVDGSTAEITNPVVRNAFLNQPLTLSAEQLDVTVRYPTPAGALVSEGWLDYFQVTARCALNWPGSGQLPFRDTRSLSQSLTSFRLSNAGGEVQVWDVTDPLRPRQQLTSLVAGGIQFTANTEVLREFVAFRPTDNLLQATSLGKIAPQNLHGITAAEMLIIYHPDFKESAERLAAHRRTFSGLEVVTVDVSQVYREFSSGKVDPTAIRDFMKMVYSRAASLRYLLLVGDGSFDCRGIYPNMGKNFIPVYENDALSEISGYAADDYYGIFEGDSQYNPLAFDLNISVGRLTVNTAAEAAAVVEKIIRYDGSAAGRNFDDWRTRMLFVGDDEDSAKHSDDADAASILASNLYPAANHEKLFFDLFPQERTPAGDFYPTVSEAIDRAVFRGVLAITYLGHGGPRRWAQESVLTIPQLQRWANSDHLPLVITATCTFAGYDDASFVSAGEEMFLSANGGAIALLSTVRPVFASRNAALTNATLRKLLSRESNGGWPTLGDVIKGAKNELSTPGSFENERKFVLLGDPAQRLLLPRYEVQTTEINGRVIAAGQPDTLRAMQEVTIGGQVVDLNGQLLANFNGVVYPTIYDKPQSVRTLQQDAGSPLRTYEVQRNVLFKGRAQVRNGRFSFTFVVPKDINYTFGPGKISYYAADAGQQVDAAGYYEGIIIGGSSASGLSDEQGPVVEVFINSTGFVSGSVVGSEPVLLVRLSDDNGINVTGNSIGHDLEAVLNEDVQNTLLLNDFYEADIDNHRKGQARFPLGKMPAGLHKVKVRAWDVANNSAEGFTEFVIADDGKIALQHVLNYPNPFTDRTCFQFDHNLAGEDLDVLIRIYTVSGRLVKTLTAQLPASDGALRADDCIAWDGKDDYGEQLARGVYVYQVNVRALGGSQLEGESEFSKLVILK